MNKIFMLILMTAVLSFVPQAEAAKKNATAAKQPVAAHEEAASNPEQDKIDTVRIEEYMNNLVGLQAEFSQTNDNGEYRHGTLLLSRPGKMRVTYDAPSKDFIVADGHFINMWDGEMKQQTSVPIDSSLGDLLLRDKVKFSGDVTVVRLVRGSAKIEITVAVTKDPGAGQLTFVFEDKPLKLRAWNVLDPQGKITTVNLENTNEHATFSSGTFTFVPPNFGQNNRNGGK